MSLDKNSFSDFGIVTRGQTDRVTGMTKLMTVKNTDIHIKISKYLFKN